MQNNFIKQQINWNKIVEMKNTMLVSTSRANKRLQIQGEKKDIKLKNWNSKVHRTFNILQKKSA